MSFVLTLFRAPDRATPDEAAAFLASAPARLAEPTRRYADFVREVSTFYPDLSESEDEADVDRNLWPEGLSGVDDPLCADTFVNIAVNLDMLEPGVMTVIARCAAGAGLQVLDEQNGLLYTLDGRVVGVNDPQPKPLPPETPLSRSLMTENVAGFRLRESQVAIAKSLASALGRGFSLAAAGDRTVVWRRHGELRQMLWLYLMRSTDQVSGKLFAQVAFASDRLTAIYLPLLPESFAARQRKYDRADGGASRQVSWHLPDLTRGDPATDAVLHGHSVMRIASAADLDRFVDAARKWTRASLRPWLDGFDSVEGLRAAAITDTRLRHCAVGRMAYPEYAGTLTLARLTGVAMLDAYADAYRRSGGVAGLTTLFKERDDRHFEQLVEGLRALPD